MRENPIEERLKSRVEAIGWQCWKFTSPGRRGVPDRICIGPEKQVEFVETKATGKTAKPLQKVIHKILGLMGFKVWIIDSYEKVDDFCRYLKAKNLI